MLSTSAWQDVKRRFPIGSIVDAEVIRVEPFGVFVGVPECLAHTILLVTEFEDGDRGFELSEYPQLGERITAVVVGHADYSRQLRVSTRLSRMTCAE